MLDLRFAGAVPRATTIVAMVVARSADEPAGPGAGDEVSGTAVLGEPPAGIGRASCRERV